MSILKPLKGADDHAYENFSALCRQDYPGKVELLFGMADAADPAAAVVRGLKANFPSCNIELIIAPTAAKNPKSSTLETLAARATGDVLVISDGDIAVTPDYLQNVTAPLADPYNGVVTCLYTGVGAEHATDTAANALERLYLACTFLPNVCVAHRLGKTVGLGATLALRRETLREIGGFAAFADYLMDDYQLARRVERTGRRIVLSPQPVKTECSGHLLEHGRREIRWARGIRASCGWADYLGMAITFSTPLAVLAVLTGGLPVWAWMTLIVSLCLRWVVGWRICAATGADVSPRDLLWLPLRDCMTAAVWTTGLFGANITWRGRRFSLLPDGRLDDPHESMLERNFRRVVTALVLRIDATLRSRQHIYEFSSDPNCLLRINVIPSPVAATLADGTQVNVGDMIGELHVWNEHLPRMNERGATMAWSAAMHRQMRKSLEQLSIYARSAPELTQIKAFHGHSLFVARHGSDHASRIASRMGFEVMPAAPPTSWLGRLHDRGEDLLVWGLAWTFNPMSVRGKSLRRPRQHFWLSRTTVANLTPAPQLPAAYARP